MRNGFIWRNVRCILLQRYGKPDTYMNTYINIKEIVATWHRKNDNDLFEVLEYIESYVKLKNVK